MPVKKQPASVQDIRLKIVYRKPDTLVEYLMNAKQHKPKQVQDVRASLDTFGFNNPILLDGKNGMVAGHCRLRAATLAPAWKVVPTVDLSHLSATEKRAYILADNRLSETNTSWDLEMLSSELQFLKGEDFDIDMTGFDNDYIINTDTKGDKKDYNPNDSKEFSEGDFETEHTCPKCGFEY